ncbi:hypothetical protein DOY81_005279 [Sarcophaga bullata]|nr:hypothetical protein DOY81_005279 [Sarcophaga bullata]
MVSQMTIAAKRPKAISMEIENFKGVIMEAEEFAANFDMFLMDCLTQLLPADFNDLVILIHTENF